ncbi:MAG: hypothetical protein ACRC3H_13080 [Lachnospiraceae bacterium]
MYIGICPEKGKRIKDEDAFSYALERCLIGEDREEFGNLFTYYIYDGCWFTEIDGFREELVEWFYSGNWQYEEE